MAKRKKLLAYSVIGLSVVAVYLAGFFDSTPEINIGPNDELVFTTERPDEDDKSILLCVPAAFSTADGIIGHYSVGGVRQGNADFRYTTIHLNRGTHFQQLTLVKNHEAKKLKDSRLRFRRALCKKKGQYSIVHSKYPVSLSTFASQLTEYDHAWNLDMGTYSYGWYRQDGHLHRLGLSTIWNRNKQTNWLIVREQ